MWNLDYVTREQALKLCEVVCFGNEPTRPVQADKGYSLSKAIMLYVGCLLFVGLYVFFLIDFIKKSQSIESVLDHVVFIASATLFSIAGIVILILSTYYTTRLIISSYKFNFARIIKYSSQFTQCFVLLAVFSFFMLIMETYYILFKTPISVTFMVILIVSIPSSILAFRYMNNRINRVISGDVNFKTVRFLSRKQIAEILAPLSAICMVCIFYLHMGTFIIFILSFALPLFIADVVFTFVRCKILYKLLCLGKIDQNDFAKQTIIYG